MAASVTRRGKNTASCHGKVAICHGMSTAQPADVCSQATAAVADPGSLGDPGNRDASRLINAAPTAMRMAATESFATMKANSIEVGGRPAGRHGTR